MEISRTRHIVGILTGAALLFSLALSTTVRNEDYGTPLTLWKSAMRTDPENPRAWLGVGETLMASNRPREAERYLEKAAELSHLSRDVSGKALLNLGIIYYNSGNREKALNTFRTLLRADPYFPQALYNLAVILSEGSDRNSPEWAEGARAFDTLKGLLPATSPRINRLKSIFKDTEIHPSP